MSQKVAIEGLRSQLDALIRSLSKPEYAPRRRRRLVDWTATSDRSIPFALLDKTVQEIVDGGFDTVVATPGVGFKKIKGLLDILERVYADHEFTAVETAPSTLPGRSVFSPSAARLRFASRQFSSLREVDWEHWRTTVTDRGPADQPLGRFVTALGDLPRKTWEVPLRFYAGCSLSRIFGLPSYGSRRVATIAETFRRVAEAAAVNALADAARPGPILDFVRNLEQLADPTERPRRASVDPLAPLTAQVEHDLGPHAAGIFLEMIGEDGRTAKSLPHVGSWGRYYRSAIARLIRVRCPETAHLIVKFNARPKRRGDDLLRARLDRLALLIRTRSARKA